MCPNKLQNFSVDSVTQKITKPEERAEGFLIPAIYQGTTAIYSNTKALELAARDSLKKNFPHYGRFGTPATKKFESLMSELEEGFDAVAVGSGLAAITTSLLAFAKADAHYLICESAYAATINFSHFLAVLGVEVEYFRNDEEMCLEKKFKPNTQLVYLETSGSKNFVLQRVTEISKACRKWDITSLIDNTWATPLFFNPLKLGIDVVIHSASKYITGTSANFLGVIVCNQATFAPIRKMAMQLGQVASPHDIHAGLIGLKTLSMRMEQHFKNAQYIANKLTQHPLIRWVNYPACEQHPQHLLWKENFQGAASLFSFVLNETLTKVEVDHFLNSLQLIKIGHGWGGFDSLITPGYDICSSQHQEWIIRLYVGLENEFAIWEDLRQGLSVLKIHTPIPTNKPF